MNRQKMTVWTGFAALPIIFLAIFLLTPGCTITPPDRFPEVQQAVADRTGQEIHWADHDQSQGDLDSAVKAILAHPLSADDAVRLALLNNHELQARFDELGIARADLLQAGLLKSPVLTVIARFPDGPPSGADVEISAEEEFIAILSMPARKKLADAEYERVKLQTAQGVVDLAVRTRSEFYAVQAAKQTLELRRLSLQSDEASAEISKRQHDAGNSSDLDWAGQQAILEQARLDSADADSDLEDHRQQLSALMGLWGEQTSWSVQGELADPPAGDFSAADLESVAIEKRLDLAAARQQVVVAAKSLGLARGLRFFPSGTIGIDTEKSPDGQRVTGPILSIPLPLFDQGQGEMMRSQARLEQASQQYTALAVEIRGEVHRACNRLNAARFRADLLRNRMLPLRQQIVDESLRRYNGMLMGLFDLLQARQNQITTRQQYIDAVKQYWVSRAELMRAVGGKIEKEKP